MPMALTAAPPMSQNQNQALVLLFKSLPPQ